MASYTLTQQDETLLSKSDSGNYQLTKYIKSKLTSENLNSLGLYRSVITSKKTNKVLCFSPPKSIPYGDFTSKYSPTDCIGEEFIEGTMINLFWDEEDNKWIISTKSVIHASCTFFMVPPYEKDKVKKFSEMFSEACAYNNFDYTLLDKRMCYSFVLQHPESRIVCKVSYPVLYLVEMYAIYSTPESGQHVITSVDISMPNLTFRQTFSGFEGSNVCVPQKYIFSSFQELEERHASNTTPFNVQGFVLKNYSTGERAKCWNPTYLYVKQLRGNNPRLDYHYIELRHTGKVKEFLKYYPEFKSQFQHYRTNIHNFTTQLYNNYVDCYILKKNKLSYFEPQYKTHMYHIHSIYLETLRNEHKSVTKNVVIEYVNGLPNALLLSNLKK